MQNLRKATWMELFFDLVFVATAHKFATYLVKDLSLIWLFIPVLWVWVGHVMYLNRFPKENAIINILTIVQMIGVVGLAVFIQNAFVSPLFGLSYVLARVALLAMYIYEFKKNHQARSTFGKLLVSFFISISLWTIGSIFNMPILWVIGSAIDVISPLINTKKLQKMPVHSGHLPERLGLLTVIFFGEVILSTIVSFSVESTLTSSIVTGFVLITMAILAYIYFSFQESCLQGKVSGSGQAYLYTHLGIYIALLMFAVAIKLLLKGSPNELLLLGSTLLYIICYKAIRLLRSQTRSFETITIAALILIINFLVFQGVVFTISHMIILSTYLFITYKN